MLSNLPSRSKISNTPSTGLSVILLSRPGVLSKVITKLICKPTIIQMAELRHLAIHCEYGNSLNDMLRDRLISPRIQRWLLAETAIDFAKALKVALAMETADRDARQLQAGQNDKAVPVVEAAVHNTGGSNSTQIGGAKYKGYQNCYRCGGRHRASVCRHKEMVWNSCGKKGYLARACRSRGTEQPRAQSQIPTPL